MEKNSFKKYGSSWDFINNFVSTIYFATLVKMRKKYRDSIVPGFIGKSAVIKSQQTFHHLLSKCHVSTNEQQFPLLPLLKAGHTPMVVQPEKIDFIALSYDLIDYFIVCFEHQCNTMGAF